MIVARVTNHSGLPGTELFPRMQDFQCQDKNKFRQIRTVVANYCLKRMEKVYMFFPVGHYIVAFIF